MTYQIITDEPELDRFITILPDLEPHEVYYLCLFARHKYDPNFPNTKDSGQLARVTAKNKPDLKNKIQKMETPTGSYQRDGIIAEQNTLALYIATNPRNLQKANKLLLTELADRFANNNITFNPNSLATTCIHRAIKRKVFVDFDFDNADPEDYDFDFLETYHVIKTRGGFHLLVKPQKGDWHPKIMKMPSVDVKGSNTLTPVPGCTQGGFTPKITKSKG